MRVDDEIRGQLATRFEVLLPHLNERQQRLALACEARLLGHGGVAAVADVARVSATTVRRGVSELDSGEEPLPVGRARRAGGGRRPVTAHDPEVAAALLGLVEPNARGDPMSPLRWTTKSLRHLAAELTAQGHPVSAPTVGRLLRAAGFSLQGTAKTLEGKQHPDRDAQFAYINEQVKAHQAEGEPAISVDAKKKEQLGQLPAAGREWRPRGDPIPVEDHSFFTAGPDVPLAIPYGVYDLGTDAGWVNVGVDHDTSAFAVASIRRWWAARGAVDHPDATKLLITADAGGSNSYRYRMWKAELAALAADTGLTITVCHFPPGTSKWNKIEHRLFSQITMNWRGRPLTSHQVVIATIASTRTRTGLRVAAELDTGSYPLGVAVPADQLRRLPITAHARHGAWNYTIAPTGAGEVVLRADERARARAANLALLANERLTGMAPDDLAELAALLAPAQAAQAAQRRFEQRGGPRRRAAGAGSTGLLTDADRVLVTVVYQRRLCSMNVLSDLLGVNANSIGQAIADTRALLAEHGRTITASTLRFATAEALMAFASSSGEEPMRPRLAERLADPALTGMTRADLAALTERIVPVLAARAERHRHRLRGGERLPGARGGVFMQKITDAERVLATVLHRRGLGTHDTLAELFEVSRRTIGGALREVGPLLDQTGYAATPAATRFTTAAELLASLPTPSADDIDTPTS
ncbi:Rhodopirellula transposase DDE domain-containing protein [Geodermatophilus africanus]|uniref:Rhodopirellula transposase DDE domain-containing protein n=4 Tax=Geodermatophilus africanus TaxID=1137993 RepID=A0A1H3RNI0_9ACTN|nr:ISAzo13 family transposase [Geodermatophilus africanus]SDZ26459.1 Rhodopirellula transposase DDE domain-containing protein [Geodermatophilus africanus]